MSKEINRNVAPSPHLSDTSLTTQRMMLDVIIALLPVIAISVWVFQWYALKVIALSALTCLIAEWITTKMRKRPATLSDASAMITGLILGLSLPWSTPWYVIVIGGAVAIVLGKAAFGGLGMNLFNPAMVGRAFVMLSFAKSVGAAAYVNTQIGIQAVTQATPLTMAKSTGASMGADSIWPLFIGNVNGSLGETSAIAILLGGLYLCFRRSAAVEIPAGVILGTIISGAIAHVLGFTPLNILQQLLAGSVLFGAFFIATDPCTSPISIKGKFIFGLGIGFLIVLLRFFSSYPEGVMFAVLLMNAAVPLLNRWTIPTPLGGKVPAPKA